MYRMWYSVNHGDGYRLGYAESDDGFTWTQSDDEIGLEPSPTDWDSQAVAYPWVFKDSQRYYMLYNGNDFGRAGFGIATGH